MAKQEQIEKLNEITNDLVYLSAHGYFDARYQRILLYLASVLKETVKGLRGDTFDSRYIAEKLDKLQHDANMISKSQ